MPISTDMDLKEFNNMIYFVQNNDDFKSKFVRRFCDYANIIYMPDKMTNEISCISDKYIKYFTNSELRWETDGKEPTAASYEAMEKYLQKEIDYIAEFFQKHPDFAASHMMNYFVVDKDLLPTGKQATFLMQASGKRPIWELTLVFK
jgi:hypothetical protein